MTKTNTLHEHVGTFTAILAELITFRMKTISYASYSENKKKHIFCSKNFSSSGAVFKIMCKVMVQSHRSQMTV
jgi:hypothetical protein